MPAVNLEGAVPSHLPVLPLKSTVVFPRIFIPLSVGRKKSLQLLEDLSGVERHIAVATQLDESAEEVDFKDSTTWARWSASSTCSNCPTAPARWPCSGSAASGRPESSRASRSPRGPPSWLRKSAGPT